MRSWFILFLTVATVSAVPFTSKADLVTAITNCLTVDSTGQMCCTVADCGAAENAEMKDWTFTSAITDMSNLFKDKPLFNAPIGEWVTSHVTTMNNMFLSAHAFNQPLTFNTAKVTDMRAMFQEAIAFDNGGQPLTFDTEQVTTMHDMFHGATAFNQPLTFDTAQVTDMRYMFQGAIAFNQPLAFDTAQVTTMADMFSGAIAFNHPLWQYWGPLPCPAGELRVDDSAGCTVPVELTCAQLKAEYQRSSRGCECSSRTSLF